MKTAIIFSVPTKTCAAGFCWRWRSADGKAASAEWFVYYYECLADARANGYDPQPLGTIGQSSPSHHALELRA